MFSSEKVVLFFDCYYINKGCSVMSGATGFM
ncbi:hypothetical protein APH_0681 [Anaplasma phagocytophilum str. HZ]|uniref:Uncharacterized protein n=1 Tax=Anaplasma phagocytophilum (strain HZ) TaxID=212042 RepID=Q2GK38_ANAPZ|nr:hypothetical protein APH_0681 [Anaplasma phagocytophilum str. HZ]